MKKVKTIPEYWLFLMGMLLLLLITSCHRQQMVVDQIPLNTPGDAPIYVFGNFNNWDPGDNRYRLEKDSTGSYSISLPSGVGRINYKFSRGDWTTIEKNECGYDRENRSLIYGENATVYNQIAAWGDIEPMNCIHKTIVVESLPENSPDDPEIYFASNVNNWNPGDVSYILEKDKKGRYFITLDKKADCLEYKFTLGNWETVEAAADLNDIENRELCFDNTDTIFVRIASWKTLDVKKKNSIVIVLEKLPEETFATDDIYLAGNFNNWDPGHTYYKFANDGYSSRYYHLTTNSQHIEFKITRGNWGSVEVSSTGRDIPNRGAWVGEVDTLFLKVDRWKDR